MAVAIVLTALLKPLADRLHPLGWPRLVGTCAVLAGALLLLAGIVSVLTPRFLHQIDQVGPALEDALVTVETWLVDPCGGPPCWLPSTRSRPRSAWPSSASLCSCRLRWSSSSSASCPSSAPSLPALSQPRWRFPSEV
ncbi:MAG: hypothetical protein KY450_13090 [Actinobacteria bacterium]|nr:hypothetical protein [Actinomycetota bacterium]